MNYPDQQLIDAIEVTNRPLIIISFALTYFPGVSLNAINYGKTILYQPNLINTQLPQTEHRENTSSLFGGTPFWKGTILHLMRRRSVWTAVLRHLLLRFM